MRELLAQVQFRGAIRERPVEIFGRLLRAIRDRPRIKGVLLDISSGGGAVVPSTDLYLAVKRLDQVKPVVASIGSVGASGGYMAALGARKLFAYADSAVGSIGVVQPAIAVKGLLDKLGIGVELIHQGAHKDAYQGYRPLTDEERSKMLASTAESYRNFVELVARERHRPVEEILPLATGEVFTGGQALRFGLVDAIGDRELALEELARLTGVRPEKTVRIEPRRTFVERMLASGFRAAGPAFRAEISDSLEELVCGGLLGR